MDFFASPTGMALLAGLVTWSFTAVGAAMVFAAKEFSRLSLDVMLGFAAGVMIAASFWSLLQPALEMASDWGRLAFVPVAIGFLSGAAALRLLDVILPHIHQMENLEEGIHTRLPRSVLLVFAITLHNIPEGLAVGVAFGAAAMGGPEASLAGALTLISGIVEPIAAVLGALAVSVAQPVLPFALAFAAGAMIFVVVEEVIPESHASGHGDAASLGVVAGFVIMMCLDVALG